jgi:hypothetical protein
MNRNQGSDSVRHGRSPQTRQEWARLVTPGRLELGPWSPLKPANALPAQEARADAAPAKEMLLGGLHSDVDPDILIDSVSTGVSFWEGFVPDPVEHPAEPESDGRPGAGG